MRNNVLKICAAAAMLLIPLPLLSLCDTISSELFRPLRYLTCYAACWLPTAAGFLTEKLKRSRTEPKKLFRARLLSVLCAAAFAVLTLVVLNIADGFTEEKLFNFGSCASLVAAVLMWYIVGMKLNERSFSDVFTFPWLAAYLTESFFCYIFAAFQQSMINDFYDGFSAALSSCCTLIAVQIIVMSMLTVLLINQSNIDAQIDRRKNVNLIVPRGLKAHNARLIITVCAVILILMLFKDAIAGFLAWIATTTAKIADMLLMNIRRQTAPMMEGSGEIRPGMMPGNSSGEHDIALYLALIAVVVLVIVFRKKIVVLFKFVANKVFGRLSKPNEAENDTEDYTDRYEVIYRRREKAENVSPSELLKRYKKEHDPVKKYRTGYRLYLMWLGKRSRKMSPSFTVEQQEKEADGLYFGECDIHKISDCYSDIRYDDSRSTEENEMNRLINELYGK